MQWFVNNTYMLIIKVYDILTSKDDYLLWTMIAFNIRKWNNDLSILLQKMHQYGIDVIDKTGLCPKWILLGPIHGKTISIEKKNDTYCISNLIKYPKYIQNSLQNVKFQHIRTNAVFTNIAWQKRANLIYQSYFLYIRALIEVLLNTLIDVNHCRKCLK